MQLRLEPIHNVSAPPHIQEAFSSVPREDFLPEDVRAYAPQDIALPIGFGQTNSQPSTVAFMLQLLDVHPGHKVLDVGSGSGWTTALLAHLVGRTGCVIGIEIVPELAEFAAHNVARHARHAHIFETHGIGFPEDAPYDRILVSASAHDIPAELVAQLQLGGIMVIPVADAILRLEKRPDGTSAKDTYEGFAFVPFRN